MDLFCTNLPEGVTENLVRGIFADYGAVSAVDFVAGYDRIHGFWHSHAFIEMPNDAEARAALLGLGGAVWGRRRLCVAVANGRPSVAPAETA